MSRAIAAASIKVAAERRLRAPTRSPRELSTGAAAQRVERAAAELDAPVLLEQQRRDDVERAGRAVEHLQRGAAAVGQADAEHALGADLAHQPRVRRASARCRSPRRRRRARGTRASRPTSRSPGRPQPAGGEPPERRREPRDRDRERPHPAAVGGARELARLDPRRLGDAALHRVLERVALVDVALDRPALGGREGEPERVLARAVVASPASGGRRPRAARSRPAGSRGSPGPQARSASLRPAADRISRTRRTWPVAAAVRRARHREMLGGRGRSARARRRARPRAPGTAWPPSGRRSTGRDRRPMHAPAARARPPRPRSVVAHATRCSLSTPAPRRTRTSASPITRRGPGRSR